MKHIGPGHTGKSSQIDCPDRLIQVCVMRKCRKALSEFGRPVTCAFCGFAVHENTGLWILARTPRLPKEVLNRYLDRIRARGFDPERLEYPRP